MARILARVALFVFALTLAINAFAGGKTKNLTLYHDAQLNGTTIPAGDYIVSYDEQGSNVEVKFWKGHKEVASATGQLKQLEKKPSLNQVIVQNGSNTPAIAEIDFGGSKTGIAFDSSMTATGK
jgi:hypothetical protein